MFASADRRRVRDQLVEATRADERVRAAAVVGSGALDREDEWSDIDLALRLIDDADLTAVAASSTDWLYRTFHVAHHLDIWQGQTLFRVYLLPNSLQVDLSFWPSAQFAASGASFRLLFGEANPAVQPAKPSAEGLIGMGWLYALHARSSIARPSLAGAIHA